MPKNGGKFAEVQGVEAAFLRETIPDGAVRANPSHRLLVPRLAIKPRNYKQIELISGNYCPIPSQLANKHIANFQIRCIPRVSKQPLQTLPDLQGFPMPLLPETDSR